MKQEMLSNKFATLESTQTLLCYIQRCSKGTHRNMKLDTDEFEGDRIEASTKKEPGSSFFVSSVKLR